MVFGPQRQRSSPYNTTEADTPEIQNTTDHTLSSSVRVSYGERPNPGTHRNTRYAGVCERITTVTRVSCFSNCQRRDGVARERGCCCRRRVPREHLARCVSSCGWQIGDEQAVTSKLCLTHLPEASDCIWSHSGAGTLERRKLPVVAHTHPDVRPRPCAHVIVGSACNGLTRLRSHLSASFYFPVRRYSRQTNTFYGLFASSARNVWLTLFRWCQMSDEFDRKEKTREIRTIFDHLTSLNALDAPILCAARTLPDSRCSVIRKRAGRNFPRRS